MDVARALSSASTEPARPPRLVEDDLRHRACAPARAMWLCRRHRRWNPEDRHAPAAPRAAAHRAVVTVDQEVAFAYRRGHLGPGVPRPVQHDLRRARARAPAVRSAAADADP